MARPQRAVAAAWVPAVLLCFGVAVWLAVVWFPAFLHPAVGSAELRGATLSDKERFDVQAARLQVQNGVRAASVQLLVGLGAIVGAVQAWRSFLEDRRDRREDFHLKLLSEALEAVGSESSAIRRAGVHSLGRLADVSPEDRAACRDVLLALVREGSAWPPADGRLSSTAEVQPSRGPNASGLPPEVQTALSLLTRGALDAQTEGLSLRELDLRRADLAGAHLERADLTRTHLEGAWMTRANLTGADLSSADCRSVVLRDGSLDGSTLDDVDFADADLQGVTMCGARYRRVRWPRTCPEAEAQARGAQPMADRQGPQVAKPT